MVSFSFLNAVDPTTIVCSVLLVVLIAALLIVPMFTNKKRAQQTEELHRSLQAGDLIKTVGGIIGTIKEIRQVSPVDREMVIETGDGDNKTTMVFDIQALYQVINRNNTVVPATEDAEDKPTEPVENAAPAVVAEAEQPVKVEEKTETVVTEPEKEEKVESTEESAQEQAAVAEIAEEENKPKAVKPAQKKPVNSAKKTSGTKKTTTK